MSKIRNIAVAVGAALSLGAASQAAAAPQFTIDTSAITGGAANTFVGDFFSGTSSELLHTVGLTHTATGWLQLSALNLNGTPQVGFGNLGTFGLYVTFSLADTLVSGTINTPGSTSALTLLDFALWADPQKDNVFTQANAATATEATVSGGGNDTFLGFGSLINGTAGISALGGAFLNSINTFGLCTGAGTADVGGVAVANAACLDGTGKAFFIDPDPFYELSFTEFNNTPQGISVVGDLVSITSATGGVDFNRVPEPATMALVALGLLGVGTSVRRKKSS